MTRLSDSNHANRLSADTFPLGAHYDRCKWRTLDQLLEAFELIRDSGRSFRMSIKAEEAELLAARLADSNQPYRRTA